MKHVLAIGDVADSPSPARTVAPGPAKVFVKANAASNDVREAAGPAVWVQQSDGSWAIRWRGNDTWWDLSARYLQAGKRWREIFNFQSDAFHARVPQPIAIYTTAIVAMPPEAVARAQLLGELAGGGGVPPTPKPGPGPSPGSRSRSAGSRTRAGPWSARSPRGALDARRDSVRAERRRSSPLVAPRRARPRRRDDDRRRRLPRASSEGTEARMTTTFEFDPVAAADALARMGNAPDGVVAIDGSQWAQGAMGVLMRAEFLAASAGVVPWITLEDGTQAIANVGAARDVIARAPESVQTLYLATHGIVRQTHAMALLWDGQTPMLQAGEDLEIGLAPLVVVVLVLGVAAIHATAAYFIHQDTIEAEGRNFRTTSILNSTLELARKQLEQTGKIDPAVTDVFRELAGTER